MDSDTITIPKSLYEQLLRDSDWLNALQVAGVDNWDGIDEAREILLNMQNIPT